MINNKIECPHCLAVGTIMEGKSTGRGFEYVTCKLCHGTGTVDSIINDDYILSLDEDNFIEDEQI